jgi:hypothetical protein
MTGDFPEPVIWLLLAIFARGNTEIIAFVLLDQDLIKHSHAEAGAGHELSVIYGRLGQHLPSPDQDPVKRPDNYLGRILATIFTLGIYMFWWFYNQMDEPNKHFTSNWAQEKSPGERRRRHQLSHPRHPGHGRGRINTLPAASPWPALQPWSRSTRGQATNAVPSSRPPTDLHAVRPQGRGEKELRLPDSHRKGHEPPPHGMLHRVGPATRFRRPPARPSRLHARPPRLLQELT